MTSAPTHDITDAPESNEAVERAVIESSQIMVKTAENALKENKYLEKVVILEHHMRHDHESKANLVHIANSMLVHLVAVSSFRSKTLIGNHSLRSFGIGKTHENYFVDKITGRYDGVNFWGPTGQSDYTGSFIKALQMTLPYLFVPSIEATPKPKPNEWRVVSSKHRRTDEQHNQSSQNPQYFQIQNKFQPLSQGNC